MIYTPACLEISFAILLLLSSPMILSIQLPVSIQILILHMTQDPEKKTFLADAIISNPVSYGHIHCAEALSIPLHIMFPQPWFPTKCFPHPLSNMPVDNQWSNSNYYSYKVLDEFMWLGLGSIINEFRQKYLGLSMIHLGEGGYSMLNDNKVPISHMWSPTFVPKCG